MSKRVWKSGPPPHVGWWEASHYKYIGMWRYWNGKKWSFWYGKYEIPPKKPPINVNQVIFWNDYYPKNARVPRIDPSK